MKKLFVIFIVFFALSFTPKIADAAEECKTVIMCDNYVVVCDEYDEIIWDEMYCSDFDDY